MRSAATCDCSRHWSRENTIAERWEIAEDSINYTTDFDCIYRRLDR